LASNKVEALPDLAKADVLTMRSFPARPGWDASLGARIEIQRGKRHPVEVRCRPWLTGCAAIGNQPFLTLQAICSKQVQEARPVVRRI
jgi:hypothetical protein